MKILVNSLTGHMLNYAVIQYLGKCDWSTKPNIMNVVRHYPYATDAGISVPLIEKGRITLGPRPEGTIWPEPWLATNPLDEDPIWYGPTLVIAGLRALVSALGDSIEIPDEVIEHEKVRIAGILSRRVKRG